MSFEDPEQLSVKKEEPLHALLLTMEQEAEVNRNSGENNEHEKKDHPEKPPYFIESFQQGDRKMTLLGTRHVSSIKEGSKDLEQYKEIDPDLVFHEGNDVRVVFSHLSDNEIRALDPQLVIEKGQENLFVAWNAFKDGKTVQSWDIPFKNQLSAMMKAHSHEAIAGWLIAQVLGKLYEKKKAPTEESIRELLPVVISFEEIDVLHTEGLDLTLPALKHACKKYLGMSLERLNERFSDEGLQKQDEGMFARFFDPAQEGETNRILHDMNVLRDEHAMDVLEKAKEQGRNILVVAGGSHVRTWKLAIAELYKERELSEKNEDIRNTIDETVLLKRGEDQRQKREGEIASAENIAQKLQEK